MEGLIAIPVFYLQSQRCVYNPIALFTNKIGSLVILFIIIILPSIIPGYNHARNLGDGHPVTFTCSGQAPRPLRRGVTGFSPPEKALQVQLMCRAVEHSTSGGYRLTPAGWHGRALWAHLPTHFLHSFLLSSSVLSSSSLPRKPFIN